MRWKGDEVTVLVLVVIIPTPFPQHPVAVCEDLCGAPRSGRKDMMVLETLERLNPIECDIQGSYHHSGGLHHNEAMRI